VETPNIKFSIFLFVLLSVIQSLATSLYFTIQQSVKSFMYYADLVLAEFLLHS